MDFSTIAHKVRKKKKLDPINKNHVLLAFDPGHTTGWAVYHGLELTAAGEIATTDIPTTVENVTKLFMEYVPNAVIIEDYRVYKWRAKHHAGSDMLTTRVIGSIETICVQNFINTIVKQPANIAKGWCTNKKLQDWGFYHKGTKHANDAIRHGAYFLIFGAIQKKDKPTRTVG